MDGQKLAVGAAFVVLGVTDLFLFVFIIFGLLGPITGDSIIGEIFLMIIRNEGGIIDIVKQIFLPLVVLASININFTERPPKTARNLIIFSVLAFVLLVVFFILFQLDNYSEEIWVRDADESYTTKEAFEATVRSFCYQVGSAIVTYIILIFGLKSRDKTIA